MRFFDSVRVWVLDPEELGIKQGNGASIHRESFKFSLAAFSGPIVSILRFLARGRGDPEYRRSFERRSSGDLRQPELRLRVFFRAHVRYAYRLVAVSMTEDESST